MFKNIVAIIVSVLIFNISYAQNDPKAKKILDALSVKLKSFKGISGNFALKSITSKGKDNGTKVGTIISKGQKYCIKQAKTEIICDGIKIYNFDGSKTITISTVEENGQTLSPQNFFSNFYDKDFTYKLLVSKSIYNEIELVPTDKRKNFSKVTIFIDKVKNMIVKAKILDKSNNIVEFSLTNVNTNATIPDTTFTFNKAKYPKDVEVLD
jgi:outer membrane lipoprotein carrier protein